MTALRLCHKPPVQCNPVSVREILFNAAFNPPFGECSERNKLRIRKIGLYYRHKSKTFQAGKGAVPFGIEAEARFSPSTSDFFRRSS